MVEATHQIEIPDGTMESFSVHPDGDSAHAAVILYMDAPGIREELRDFCRRIAGEGYYVLLPDMYYRPGTSTFDYDELIARDKTSLDIFWLRDESLEDSANLPDPDVLAAEIAEDLRAALEQIEEVLEDLEAGQTVDRTVAE